MPTDVFLEDAGLLVERFEYRVNLFSAKRHYISAGVLQVRAGANLGNRYRSGFLHEKLAVEVTSAKRFAQDMANLFSYAQLALGRFGRTVVFHCQGSNSLTSLDTCAERIRSGNVLLRQVHSTQ